MHQSSGFGRKGVQIPHTRMIYSSLMVYVEVSIFPLTVYSGVDNPGSRQLCRHPLHSSLFGVRKIENYWLVREIYVALILSSVFAVFEARFTSRYLIQNVILQ